MKTKLLILSIILWFACDSPSQPGAELAPKILNSYLTYNKITDELFIQVEVDDEQGLENIDSVFVEIRYSRDATFFDEKFYLNDAGVDGDLLAESGVYSLLITEMDSITTDSLPPQITSVVMPDDFELDRSEWIDLDISVTITGNIYEFKSIVIDKDGHVTEYLKYVNLDNSVVLYYINSDEMFKDDENTEFCDWEQGLTNDGFIDDETWLMISAEPGNLNNTFIYSTKIPMKSIDDCGGTGKVHFLFQAINLDNGGYSEMLDSLYIYGCGDGICADEYEDTETCPEDCP